MFNILGNGEEVTVCYDFLNHLRNNLNVFINIQKTIIFIII